MIPNVPQIKEITNEPDFNSPLPVTGPRPNRPTSKHPSGKAADAGELQHQDKKPDQEKNKGTTKKSG